MKKAIFISIITAAVVVIAAGGFLAGIRYTVTHQKIYSDPDHSGVVYSEIMGQIHEFIID